MKVLLTIVGTIVGTLGALVLIYVGMVAVGAWHQGHRWAEMDWDGSGGTSIAEFLESSDVGRRETIVDGRTCSDFFSYKDGKSIRVDCPPSPQ